MSTGNPESQSQDASVSVSIVVPVYSGADYLEKLVEAVKVLRDGLATENAPVAVAELILVDDASTDGSSQLIDWLASENYWLVPLHLSRNFGQHAATIAGILHSSGDWVVTMDEDLQHPPDRVPQLLRRAVTNGADVVYANADGAVHETFLRDLTSRTFKRFMQWLTGNPKLRYFNSFRLIRGSVARAVSSVCSHDTYFDVNLSWFTQRIEVEQMALKDERYIRTGKSGYSFRSLLAHGWRMVFSSQIKVLRFGALLGFAVLVLSTFGIIYFLTIKLIFPERVQVQGWTSLILRDFLFWRPAVVHDGDRPAVFVHAHSESPWKTDFLYCRPLNGPQSGCLVRRSNAMKLLFWTHQKERAPGVVLLFGTGLMGGAIQRAFCANVFATERSMPYDWADAKKRAAQARDIETAVLDAAKSGLERISVVWASGRSGFGSTEDELQAETALLAEVFDIAGRLEKGLPGVLHDFHMISSAGGLFEGMTHCHSETPPQPKRPYGEGKLIQESVLRDSTTRILRRIYRPSSVYGHQPGGRLGLISALIGNALTGRTTRIVGSLNTIRDYVFSEDIGRFVSEQIRRPSVLPCETFLMASGRPTSVFEANRLVEETMRSPLLLQFDPSPSNARNTSFLFSALPRNWRPTSLKVGIERTASQMRKHLLYLD